jgi:subtilisin family serine protease
MEGDAVRIKVGAALAFVVLIGSLMIGIPAGARVPTAQRPIGTKLPWRSGGVRTVPGQFVVVWRASASRADTRALATQVGGEASPPVSNVQIVRIAPGASTAAAIQTYRRSPLVRFAEPDRIADAAAPPNDTLFGQQWALDNTGQTHKVAKYRGLSGSNKTGNTDADVDAPEAWAAQAVHTPTVVAVLDTGVDTNHPDLQNSLWVNTAEQAGNPGVDDDSNGYIDDVTGWDFFDKDPNPRPSGGLINSHGTHVAGIVAAERDNATGISGVCGDCQIMALRIGDAKHLSLGRELKAIHYAIRNGANVINLSLGSPVYSPAERQAIDKAGDAGILVVAAAGNASLDNDIGFYNRYGTAPSFPASYTLRNILSVAASNDRDRYGYISQCEGQVQLWRCGFTSWGHDSVDVAAPGVDILSTVKTSLSGTAYPGYDVWDGTSMATPLVAGIAGLVFAENPGYTPIQVKNAIMNSVDKPSSLKLYTNWARAFGLPKHALSGHFTRTQGRVNALAALTGSTATATPQTDGNIDGARSIDVRRTGRVAWPGDVNDVYKKRLVDGRRYRVTLNGPPGADFDLWIWKPGTKEIYQLTLGCFQQGGSCPAFAANSTSPHADEAVSFRAHKTGTFFIQANAFYSSGRYALKIRRI